LAVGIGMVGYVGGLFMLCLKGLTAEGRLRLPRAVWYILLTLLSLVLWVMGLLKG